MCFYAFLDAFTFFLGLLGRALPYEPFTIFPFLVRRSPFPILDSNVLNE